MALRGAAVAGHGAQRARAAPSNFDDVVEFCRDAAAATRGLLLIEGIGGIMVPLDDRHTVLDWMTVAARSPSSWSPAAIVGTISHTLTALHVLARRNLDIAAVVVSESEGSAASPRRDRTLAIAQFADAIDVVGSSALSRSRERARASRPSTWQRSPRLMIADAFADAGLPVSGYG